MRHYPTSLLLAISLAVLVAPGCAGPGALDDESDAPVLRQATGTCGEEPWHVDLGDTMAIPRAEVCSDDECLEIETRRSPGTTEIRMVCGIGDGTWMLTWIAP